MPAEAERIRHGGLYLCRARLVGHIVKVAFRVGVGQVDGRRYEAMLHGQHGDIASMLPAAPRRCPSIDLLAVIGICRARSAQRHS